MQPRIRTDPAKVRTTCSLFGSVTVTDSFYCPDSVQQ